MAQIKNSGTLREITEAGNLQTGFDQIPTEASKSVVYTMEVNPKMMRRCTVVKSGAAVNATSSTMYTTPSDKDFYLIAMALSVIKDVTATSTVSAINATIDGQATNILQIAGITLTVQENNISLALPIPLKVDRGTVISATNSTNVGNVAARANIFGYTVENQGA